MPVYASEEALAVSTGLVDWASDVFSPEVAELVPVPDGLLVGGAGGVLE